MRFALILVSAVLAVDPFGWDQHGPFRWALISTIGFSAIAVSLGSGDTRRQPLPRWSVLGWIVVIAGMVVSTALSTDRWHALIGTPDRHLGLATWLLFAGLFATASLYPTEFLSELRSVSAFVAFVAGLWAILEVRHLGWFSSDFADNRAGGPLGQPAFLGAAMTLSVPVALAPVFDRSQSRWTRVFGLIGGSFGIAALLLSQSRAAWVGFALAALCVVLQRRRWLLGGLGLLAVIALFATTSLGDRAETLTELGDGVVAARTDEWSVAARALVDTPTFGVFGHGPEGYRTVFGEHVDEAYVIRHGRDVITDRAHNGLLDTSLGGGLVAGLGFVLLQAGLVIISLQRMRSDEAVDVALGAAIVGYLAQQFFLFPLAELDPVLWVFAGILVARRPQRLVTTPPLFRSVSGASRMVMLAAGFLSAVSAVAGLSDVAADHAVVDAVESSDDLLAQQAADLARSRRPDSIRYDFIASRLHSRGGSLDGLQLALVRIDEGLGISPLDPAFLEERASLLLEIARRTDQPEDFALALDALEALDGSDPNNPKTELDHGIALANSGRPDEAIVELEHSALLDPNAIEPHLNLALVYLESGDLEKGRFELDAVDELAPANALADSLRQEFLSE